MAQTRRRQVDRSSETQALLLHAAAELLQEVGFAGATTVLIARRAGVTTGALHHHFATKDDLMLGVLDRMTERVLHRIEQQDHVTPDGRIDVPSLVAHLWEIYGDPGYWAIWEIIIGTRADAAFHGKVVAHRQETMRRVLPSWLERHVLSEARRPDLAALFEFLLIAIRGLSLERFLDKEAAYFDRNLALLAELVDRKLANLAGGT